MQNSWYVYDLCTKFHIPTWNDFLVIAIKLRAKYRFYATIMFFLPYKKLLQLNLNIFKAFYHVILHDLTLSDTNIRPTLTEVCMANMFVLLMTETY
jgi:hypothetical protein